MVLESHHVDEEDGRSLSLFVVVLGAVVLIALGAVAASLVRGKAQIVVLSRDLPAFSRLSSADLTTKSVASEGRPDSTADVTALVGKYTGKPLSKGQEITSEDVIEGGAHGLGAVRFQLHPDQVDALGLTPGDEIRLWLAPSEERGKGIAICARLLAIPHADSAAEQTYVVGVSRVNAHRLIGRLGRSRLLVTYLR